VPALAKGKPEHRSVFIEVRALRCVTSVRAAATPQAAQCSIMPLSHEAGHKTEALTLKNQGWRLTTRVACSNLQSSDGTPPAPALSHSAQAAVTSEEAL